MDDDLKQEIQRTIRKWTMANMAHHQAHCDWMAEQRRLHGDAYEKWDPNPWNSLTGRDRKE